MNTNPLTLIPARARLYAYLVFGFAGLIVSSVAVYYTAIHEAVPVWVGGAAAVLGSLAAPFGALAGSNVPQPAAPAADVPPTPGTPGAPLTLGAGD